MSKLSRHKSFKELKASEKGAGALNTKLQREYKAFIAELQDMLVKAKSGKKTQTK